MTQTIYSIYKNEESQHGLVEIINMYGNKYYEFVRVLAIGIKNLKRKFKFSTN